MQKTLVVLAGAGIALFAASALFRLRADEPTVPQFTPLPPIRKKGTGFSLSLDFLTGPQEPEPTLIAQTTQPMQTMMTPAFTAPRTTVTVPHIFATQPPESKEDIVPEVPVPTKRQVRYEDIPEGDIRRTKYYIPAPIQPSMLVVPTAIPTPTMMGPAV